MATDVVNQNSPESDQTRDSFWLTSSACTFLGAPDNPLKRITSAYTSSRGGALSLMMAALPKRDQEYSQPGVLENARHPVPSSHGPNLIRLRSRRDPMRTLRLIFIAWENFNNSHFLRSLNIVNWMEGLRPFQYRA